MMRAAFFDVGDTLVEAWKVVGRRKPNRAMYERALQIAGCSPRGLL